MPHHHGSFGTSAGVSQGTSSTSGGQGRQDPEGGYAPEHKYSKTSKQMAAQGPQYQTGTRGTTGGKPIIDIRKTGENIAMGQGAKLLGVDPITSLLVAPIVRAFTGRKKDKSFKTEHKGLRQDPKTGAYYHKAPKHRPIIDRGGDGDGGTQMASQPAQPKISPFKPYYMGFDFQKPINTATHRPLPLRRGGLSGGERFGPPPKKGPNPHGKCPFRPDGIRGVGAVEKGRGVKFIGTK